MNRYQVRIPNSEQQRKHLLPVVVVEEGDWRGRKVSFRLTTKKAITVTMSVTEIRKLGRRLCQLADAIEDIENVSGAR